VICDIARSVPTQFTQCEEKCSSVQYIRAVDLPAHRGFLLGAFGYFFFWNLQRGNKDVLKFLRPYARVKLYSGGRGRGQGGLNLPLPVPFDPGSRPVFVASRLFAFFFNCSCITFPFFSRFPPPWESRFPPPFLPVSRPPCPPPSPLYKLCKTTVKRVGLEFVLGLN